MQGAWQMPRNGTRRRCSAAIILVVFCEHGGMVDNQFLGPMPHGNNRRYRLCPKTVMLGLHLAYFMFLILCSFKLLLPCLGRLDWAYSVHGTAAGSSTENRLMGPCMHWTLGRSSGTWVPFIGCGKDLVDAF